MMRQKYKHTKRRLELGLAALGIGLMLFLTACGSLTPMGQSASQEKAHLDALIQQAAKIGVPNTLLEPIRQQEARVANQLAPLGLFGDQNPDSAYQDAITSYKILESQVASVIAQATTQAKFQANQDIQTFNGLLQQRQNQGFDREVPGYQARLMKAQQQFDAGKTPNDFYAVSAFARQQAEALELLWPTYLQLDSLNDTIIRMKKAKLNTALAEQEYQDDLEAFRAASEPAHYKKLQSILAAQLNQLAADQVAAIPFVGAAMLDSYQKMITEAEGYGVDVTAYQAQLDKDRQDLASAKTLQEYLELSTRIQTQINKMQGVVVKGRTNYHLNQLKDLIGQTSITNDYEYRDADGAYLQELALFEQASTVAEYQEIDTQVQILITNLRALLKNLKDKTPHTQAHATDLELMQTYHLMTGKVMVTSFTEQYLRLYQDGKLVRAIPVVTGQPAAQSPPGLFHILWKDTDLTFKSSYPPDSPLWYPDTPINYGMLYRDGGYFFHDATWRWYFGPGANLPHDDWTSPGHSNVGTHGCINMSLENTAWLYDWTEVGTPAINY